MKIPYQLKSIKKKNQSMRSLLKEHSTVFSVLLNRKMILIRSVFLIFVWFRIQEKVPDPSGSETLLVPIVDEDHSIILKFI